MKVKVRYTHIWCDLDQNFTKIKSARAFIGIYYHTKFENDILNPVEVRLLTDKPTSKQH